MNETRLQLVMSDVAAERFRQDRLKASGKFNWTCADVYTTITFGPSTSATHRIDDEAKLAVLAEEFGEIAKLVVEQIIDRERRSVLDLRKELIQVAAVAVAWCEALDEEREKKQ